jgi:cytidine deaminase
MVNRETQFQRILETFNPTLRKYLQFIPQNSGKLDSEHCKSIIETLGFSAEDLMLNLLPIAQLYARVPISNFNVGAVAKARLSEGSAEYAFFSGANIEFTGLALTQTIHAEQTAVMNAWLQGAVKIDAIAASTVPCGRCRQFLYELEESSTLDVIVQRPEADEFNITLLSDLLPQAFGPLDLQVKAGLTSPPEYLPNLTLETISDDSMVLEALSAARRSYAPYTHNFAGCAIQVSDTKIYSGRYVENAAFNPSLSPLHTAIIRMHMDNLSSSNIITRAVLVEKPTTIRQRGICELLIGTLAPEVQLEYIEAVERDEKTR